MSRSAPRSSGRRNRIRSSRFASRPRKHARWRRSRRTTIPIDSSKGATIPKVSTTAKNPPPPDRRPISARGPRPQRAARLRTEMHLPKQAKQCAAAGRRARNREHPVPGRGRLCVAAAPQRERAPIRGWRRAWMCPSTCLAADRFPMWIGHISARLKLQGKRPLPQPISCANLGRRTENARKFGGTEKSEQAVELSLKWLAANQSTAGFWDGDAYGAGNVVADVDGRDERGVFIKDGIPGRHADTGLTGLAILAFLGTGYTHEDGPYTKNVEHALHWLIKQQQDDGYLGGDADLLRTHVLPRDGHLCPGRGLRHAERPDGGYGGIARPAGQGRRLHSRQSESRRRMALPQGTEKRHEHVRLAIDGAQKCRHCRPAHSQGNAGADAEVPPRKRSWAITRGWPLSARRNPPCRPRPP